MHETRKTVNGGQPLTVLKREKPNVNLCKKAIINPRKVQLFGVFDQDTKTAVIILAGEVSI